MKKLFAFLVIAAITSCSGDDNATETTQPDNLLLKKTVTLSPSGETSTNFYTYEGNKLVSILDNNGLGTQFTYTGNLITYTKRTDSNSETETTLEYNNNNQKTKIMNHGKLIIDNTVYEQWKKQIFSYNEDGSVSVTTSVAHQENDWTLPSTEIITYTGNSIIYLTTTITYDDKNHPMKNVIGYEEYTMPYNFLHNILNMNIEGVGYADYSYTYNTNSYPVTLSNVIHFQDQSPNTTEVQYFYE